MVNGLPDYIDTEFTSDDVHDPNLASLIAGDVKNRPVMAPPMALLSTLTESPIHLENSQNGEPVNLADNGDDVFIQVSQILIDQAIMSVTCPSQLPSDRGLMSNHKNLSPYQMKKILGVIKSCLGRAEAHHLHGLINSTDAHQVRQGLFRLDEPMFSIRRMNTKVDILPPALDFWEDLGLEPLSAHKDVVALAIAHFPQEHLYQPMKTFLAQMLDAYQTCNLGLHNILDDDVASDGIAELDYEAVGQRLARQDPPPNAFIVYVVAPNSTASHNYDICSGIWRLLQSFRSSISTQEVSCDIIVKIVPKHLVFNTKYPAMPTFDEYKKLAFEVYDRCGPVRESSKASWSTEPAIALAQELPSNIDFQLTSDSSSAKLYHDNRLHIAYAWEIDSAWLTASWTDNTGILQWNAAYIIGNDEDLWLEFGKAASEIWKVTLAMLIPRSRATRIFIAKEGKFHSNEMKGKFTPAISRHLTYYSTAWRDATSQHKSPHVLTFVTINSKATLQFSLPLPVYEPLSDPIDQPLTPAATPSAAGNSPEVAATPGAGGFEQESDAKLVDIRQETWMLLPPTNLEHDPYTSSPFGQPMKEGYLLKRAGPNDGDGVVTLAVSIMQIDEDQPDLLLETLQMFHKLATLARQRHVVDPLVGMLPIHVAAATEGYDAVSSSMRVGGARVE